MTVNSGFQHKATISEIFTDEIAKRVFGEDAEFVVSMLTDRDRDHEDHTVQPEAVFSLAGALTVSESGPWISRVGGTLIQILAVLKTPGSSATVLTFYKNGTSFGTMTIPASANTAIAPFNITFMNDVDRMHVGITTVGTGANSLTVHGRFV